MDRTFSNTAAAICGGIAIAEFIFFIVYISITGVRLRRKIISMGRLIPAVPIVLVAPTHVIETFPSNSYPAFPQVQSAQQPPPPPGYQPYDNPPPYSAFEPKPQSST